MKHIDGSETGVLRVTAGALVRREVRALADMFGLAYVEHKGLLDSIFVLYGDDGQLSKMLVRVKSFGEGQS